MKKVVRLTESDLNRIVKRILNEDLFVSDNGELIGNIHPNEELIHFSNGDYGDADHELIYSLGERFSSEEVKDSYEFGYINSNNEYGFIKLDKNNGDKVYRENGDDMFIIKDGYWYACGEQYGPFSLYDKDPTVPYLDEELHINEMGSFPDFAMDMSSKGFKKYYFIY